MRCEDVRFKELDEIGGNGVPGKELCHEARHFIASCRRCWDGEIMAEPGVDDIARLRFPAGADVIVIGAHALGASAWDRIVSVFPRSNVPFPYVSRARIVAIVCLKPMSA